MGAKQKRLLSEDPLVQGSIDGNYERLMMMNTACPIEGSHGELCGENSARPGTVKDKITVSRTRPHGDWAGSVSRPISEFTDLEHSCLRNATCHAFGNALRGWIYALLASAVLWAVIIGVTYSLVKR